MVIGTVVACLVFGLMLVLKVLELRSGFLEQRRAFDNRQAYVIGERGPELVLSPKLAAKACNHWPRTPVTITTGEQVAAICGKCGVTLYNETWIGGES